MASKAVQAAQARYREANRERLRRESLSRYYAQKPVMRERARRYQANIPREIRRARKRLARGLPIPTRPEPNNCECCGKDSLFCARGLHLDHDHQTGKFRGWLCGDCNTGIGKLGDTADGLLTAIEYIERTRLLA